MILRSVMLLCIAWLMLWAPDAEAKRVALLIGNQNYAREVGPLKNPVNDVNLIAQALRQIGFGDAAIRIVPNASRHTILAEIDRYADRLAAAGKGAVGFFYYSGHGASNRRDQQNYLIPVDAKALDASVWYDAVKLDDIVGKLNSLASNAAHFVIFDACRNVLNMPTKGSKGFAPVASRRGMLIAFSTDPGETASDAGDGSGPYAAALAAELVQPGLDHVSLFQNVKERVVAKVRNQVPWERNGLVSRVYLAGQQPRPPMSNAASAWSVVEKSSNCSLVRAFADEYPGTVWSRFADSRLKALGCNQVASLSPPKSPAASDDCDGVAVSLGSGPTACIKPSSGKSFRDCPSCPEMVVLPAGRFVMGSPEGEAAREGSEGPQHHVTIPTPIAVGKYEITLAEWKACSDCPSLKSTGALKSGPAAPVTSVSWDHANIYVKWLSQKSDRRYRLMSESEWEYATRAGTTMPFNTGASISSSQANFDAREIYGVGSAGQYRAVATDVGNFSANSFGLHDLHGNAGEWVVDCWNLSFAAKPSRLTESGLPWTSGNCHRRIVRGGSWGMPPRMLRSAARLPVTATTESDQIGFRVARDI